MKKKVFVGRENELEQFRYTLKKLQAEHGQEEQYANTILVYGVGGMGKTSLCNKFTDIIESEFPSLVHIDIDWDLCKNRGSTFTSEELLDTVARAFTDLFPKEMKPYLGAKKDIKKEQEKIERLLEQKMQALNTVANTANEVTTVQTGSTALGTVVATGLNLIGKGLSAIDEKYLKEKAGVSGERLRLYKDPVSSLAHRLLDCIATITGKKGKQIVLILDTCELIVREEDWFAGHFLIPLVDGNPGVLLIFSGRYNPYTQRAVVIDGQSLDIRGMADRMSYPPQRIDMQLFSRKDIEKYLKEMEGESPGDNVVDFVQTFSRGVPFAVDLLTNALERLGTERFLTEFGDSDFRDQLKQEITNEAVIWSVSRRFLKYCLDESGNKVDRDRLFSIAILGDTDTGILKVVWDVENPSDILEELQAKYALLIGKGKLHDVVKDFLIDYLMENENLRTEIAKPFAEKALPIYQKKYQEECEEEPVWEDRFREDLWKDALQRLFNAMTWISPNEAVDFFIERSIELFLFNPSLIHKLKEPLDKFLNLEKGIRRKNRRKINAIMKSLDDYAWYTWSDEKGEGLINVLSFCSNALAEWELEPVHRAILQLIKGRTEYNQKNYEGAFDTLLERVDETPLDKSLRNKLAKSLDDVGKKFSLGHNNLFFFSDKSLKAFDKAVKLNEKNTLYLYHLGAMFYASNNLQKAIKMLQKAIQINPKEAYTLNGLGIVYHKLEDYGEAIDMHQRAIQIDPKLASSFYGLGRVYSSLQDYDKAIEAYQKAIQIDPKDAPPYNGLGYAYLKMNRYTDAITYS